MARMSKTDTLSPSPIGVKEILVKALKPNPHNPRLLFDREPLDILRASIENVGILVPLTVYKASGEKQFTILDGQRRWMCAQEIGLRTLPVNEVGEPTVTQNIVTMFQIHKLRKDWELMPTALKLGVLMDAMEERGDKPLAELTGLDVAVVQRCKKLLWYSLKYQETMLFPEPGERVKADFFIELYPVVTDRSVVKAAWYKRDYLIDRMLEKYQNRWSGIKGITDFRKIKQHITAARKANKEIVILRKLDQFLADDNLLISHLEITEAKIGRQAITLTRNLKKIHAALLEIDPKDFYGEEKFWIELERLVKTIRRKLRGADRRPK